MSPRRARAPLLVGLLLCAALAGACYQDPNAQLDQLQESLDLEATLNDLANRTSELQFAVDSLRGVVARQDTALGRLANLAGVPYPR